MKVSVNIFADCEKVKTLRYDSDKLSPSHCPIDDDRIYTVNRQTERHFVEVASDAIHGWRDTTNPYHRLMISEWVELRKRMGTLCDSYDVHVVGSNDLHNVGSCIVSNIQLDRIEAEGQPIYYPFGRSPAERRKRLKVIG